MNPDYSDYRRKAGRYSRLLYLLLRNQKRCIKREAWDQAELFFPAIRRAAASLEILSGRLSKKNNKFLSEILPACTLNVLEDCIRLNEEAENSFRSGAAAASRELFIYKADLAILKLREAEESDEQTG